MIKIKTLVELVHCVLLFINAELLKQLQKSQVRKLNQTNSVIQ